MTFNPYRFVVLLVASFVLVIGLALAGATQPPCTGDRHYDETGQCCPVPVDCPQVPECGPCPVTICAPVDCTCLTENKTTVVQVAPVVCPAVEFPAYAPCFERPAGKRRVGDVIFGGRAYKCPRKGTPHRYFIPQPAEAK